MENFRLVRFMNKTSFGWFFLVQVVSQAFGLKQPYWQKGLVMLVKWLPKHFQKLPEVTGFSNWSDEG